jgi:hypothetical protein
VGVPVNSIRMSTYTYQPKIRSKIIVKISYVYKVRILSKQYTYIHYLQIVCTLSWQAYSYQSYIQLGYTEGLHFCILMKLKRNI